jgi:hypothetical protein
MTAIIGNIETARGKAIKGPGLKSAGVIVLQFLLIFIFEATEYSLTKVGLFTGLAILISWVGGAILGRKGTSYVNAINPPIVFLISTLFIYSTIGGAGIKVTKIGLDLVNALSGVAPYLIIGSVIAWIAHFAIARSENKN